MDDTSASHTNPRRSTAPQRPPIQWPSRQAMIQRPNTSGDNTYDDNRAANIVRQQVDRALTQNGAPSSHVEMKPIDTRPAQTQTLTHERVIQPLEPSAQSPDTRPTPTRTLRDQPYDWNTYHSAWQQYYYQYFGNYYGNWLKEQTSTIAQQAAQHAKSADEDARLSETQKAIRKFRSRIRAKVNERAQKFTASTHFKPALVAFVVAITILLANYNQVIVGAIKQYIAPGSVVTTPVIVEPNVAAMIGPEPKIIIPTIGVEVPVVYDEKRVDEASYQKALERGVVHLGPTALPGTKGNVVIGGHSSNNVFNPGKYKYAFVNLNRLSGGETLYLHYNGVRYTYKVTVAHKIISPKDTSVLAQTPNSVLTLFTCDPPGTDINRLIIQAEQIDPNPNQQPAAPTETIKADQNNPLPANSKTLLERIFGW